MRRGLRLLLRVFFSLPLAVLLSPLSPLLLLNGLVSFLQRTAGVPNHSTYMLR